MIILRDVLRMLSDGREIFSTVKAALEAFLIEV